MMPAFTLVLVLMIVFPFFWVLRFWRFGSRGLQSDEAALHVGLGFHGRIPFFEILAMCRRDLFLNPSMPPTPDRAHAEPEIDHEIRNEARGD